MYNFWFLIKKSWRKSVSKNCPQFDFLVENRSQMVSLLDVLVPSCIRSQMALCLVGIVPSLFCSQFVLFLDCRSKFVLFLDVPARWHLLIICILINSKSKLFYLNLFQNLGCSMSWKKSISANLTSQVTSFNDSGTELVERIQTQSKYAIK